MANLSFILIVIIAIISSSDGGGTALEDRRIRNLQRKMTKMNKWLTGVRNGHYGCNDTIYSMSKTVSQIAGLVDHLYKGPLLAKVDLSKGYNTYDQVLMKLPDAMETCLKTYEGTQMPRANAQIYCLQTIAWRYEVPVSARRIRAARRTVQRFSMRMDRPFTPIRPRIRKEYRVLSDFERNRFHEAMNELYQDGTIAAFRLAHRDGRSGAHTGPAFLPWHRTFILSLENAMREKKPGITLPYWASSIDDQMSNPANSKIWTSDFLGNGGGDVVTGPFQDWVTNNGPLERMYGETGRLVSKEKIEDIMDLCYFKDVSLPNAIQSIEGPHNGVHRWVGGDMSSTGTAPWDPVFYLHHCYIDYIWEKFRHRQRSVCGVDPATDYDYDADIADQHFDDQMLEQNYTIAQGMSNFWTSWVYRYEDVPSCDNNCGDSEHLWCPWWLDCCVQRPRILGPSDFRAFFPGSGDSGSQSRTLAVAATSQCNPYLDPGCLKQQIVRNDKAGIPLQPELELAVMEASVPVNRGELFPLIDADSFDTRSLRTLKYDVEQEIKERNRRFPT